jgi:lipopolysaccharide transport system ATP-binding protein
MGECVIQAHGIWKRFARTQGHGLALHEAFERVTLAPLPRSVAAGNSGAKEIPWALREISFSVQPGECVGLIGHNGAGKSVLLRILARVTRPTIGQARLVGRVGAVLEVGAGFNRELTVRENVFLNGAILGMKMNEITHKFDDIIAFAEMAAVVDQPLKTCSTGMNVRLAFAIASQLEPQILLMDEVFAVADEAFQSACIEKLRILSQEGRTIIIASHDTSLISKICSRTIWLNQGRLMLDAETRQVEASYHKAMTGPKG